MYAFFYTGDLKGLNSPLSILFALDGGQLLHLRVDLVGETDVSSLALLKGHVRLRVTEDDSGMPDVDPGRFHLVAPLVLGPANELLPVVPVRGPLDDEASFVIEVNALIVIHDSLRVLKP